MALRRRPHPRAERAARGIQHHAVDAGRHEPGDRPQAAREFAKAELANHLYVMVLHTHQANPHVHMAVRAEGRDGQRLNPRKQDLRRWREVFAERLRGWGIEAEASSQVTRGSRHRTERLWQRKAYDNGRGAGVADSPTQS